MSITRRHLSTNRNNHQPMSTPATSILLPTTFFAMIFGNVHVVTTARHRQRMAMIDKGMDPGG